MNRQRPDDPGLFSEGEGLDVFIRTALRQALESEKRIEVALPPVGDCRVLADHFHWHKDLVDSFIADRLAAQAQILAPQDELVKHRLVQICKGQVLEVGEKVVFDIAVVPWDQRFKNQPVSSVKMSATRG